jgi:cobyrinic acid a,c-diamide synthase
MDSQGSNTERPAAATNAVPRLVIAGASSGVGKTTLTAGLIAALRARGLTVQPFKVGPDYIDPTYHTLAAGRPCRNLDGWMLPPAALGAVFAHGCCGADIALIEGVMGLFDGFGYEGDEGSTASLAKLLAAPVVVVLDAAGLARSAGALALGYARFDPALRVVGFIANNVAGASHGAGIAAAIRAATGLPCLGWLPRRPELVIPERHLGLIPVQEPGRWAEFIAAAADHVAAHVDLDALLRLAADPQPAGPGNDRPAPQPSFDKLRACPERSEGTGSACQAGGGAVPPLSPTSKPRIAVARDEAFSFYYQDNLELLEEAGAEIAFFSPLREAALPPAIDGLYLGGGFPEVYAAKLAENRPLQRDVRRAIAAGLPTYAECGGLMYLTESLTDLSGASHPMVGALPGRSIMTPRLVLGYRVATMVRDTFLAPAGCWMRGHEFHYSEWVERPVDAPYAYEIVPRGGDAPRCEGYATGALVASYVHLYFAAIPGLAQRWVAACRCFMNQRRGLL